MIISFKWAALLTRVDITSFRLCEKCREKKEFTVLQSAAEEAR